ncbi:MCP four helix bundle domain-containing protein [Psychrobium sp. nBUS_13]|uniref:MCP four helix bundle domain-containing protein n=1 Tax=Psychrobium sp. nBUS_13 TaxID=3395319 RepID=UPI003EB88107
MNSKDQQTLVNNVKISTKIYAVSGIFLTGMVLILGYMGVLVLQKIDDIEHVANTSANRVEQASLVQSSINDLDLALITLIAIDDKAGTRQATVASIKAGAQLDKILNQLKTVTNDSPLSIQLLEAVNSIRLQRMKIIKFGRKNNDQNAISVLNQIKPTLAKIRQLSKTLTQQEIESQVININATKNDLMHTIIVVASFGGLGVLIGITLSYVAVRMMSNPLREIEYIMRLVSRGDLTQEINSQNTGRDEIGMTLRGIKDTVINIRSAVIDIRKASDSVSSGSKTSTCGE